MRFIYSVLIILWTCTFAKAQAHLYSDTTYHLLENKAVVIRNSLPKGGGYTDPAGKKLGYVVFWTSVKNETTTALALTVNFPAEAYTTLLTAGSVLKIFLPTDTMTLAKEGSYDFGATGLKSTLDAGVNKSTRLQRTINPHEEYFFYVAILIQAWPDVNGSLRTGLTLKGTELFYRVSMSGYPKSALVPCGKIVLSN